MRAHEFISESGLSVDVPNEDWLAGKIEYAKKKGRDSYGVPYLGSTTASARNVRVPVDILKRLPGMKNEQSNVRQKDLDWLVNYMGTHNRLPPFRPDRTEEYTPFINVAWNGEAWGNEGNHRIMAAAKLGWKDLPIQISYFDGGERVESGAMYPGKIGLGQVTEQGVAEGKVKLYTDPSYFGAEVDDTGFDSLPVVNIPTNRLVGFEPDNKMNQPASKANVEKIVAGLKQGAKLPPLLVRQYKNGYQVLDGHHRFWAYKLLNVKSIPAQVVPAEDIEEITKQGVAENFADGKNPGRRGLSKRMGVNTKASVSSLRNTAKHSSGEKARMAHWLANMKAGKAKARRK